jgi:hypothetical protein
MVGKFNRRLCSIRCLSPKEELILAKAARISNFGHQERVLPEIAAAMRRYANLVLLSASLLSCNKTDQPLPTNAPVTKTACLESRPTIRRVDNLVGQIKYTPGQELYSINYSVPGTYDSVWIGFACNLPDEYKTVGKQVIFSGEYREGPKGLTTFAGAEVYYLFLTSIRSK